MGMGLADFIRRKVSRRESHEIEGFVGDGTVLYTELRNWDFFETYTPSQMIKFLNKYLTNSIEIIEQHSGTVVQYEGNVIQAFWHPQINAVDHAQSAFNGAKEILSAYKNQISKYKTYPGLCIALGTEELIGDFFGPIRQFQILGKACLMAEKLLSAYKSDQSKILLTGRTAQRLNISKDTFQTVGEIELSDETLTCLSFVH